MSLKEEKQQAYDQLAIPLKEEFSRQLTNDDVLVQVNERETFSPQLLILNVYLHKDKVEQILSKVKQSNLDYMDIPLIPSEENPDYVLTGRVSFFRKDKDNKRLPDFEDPDRPEENAILQSAIKDKDHLITNEFKPFSYFDPVLAPHWMSVSHDSPRKTNPFLGLRWGSRVRRIVFDFLANQGHELLLGFPNLEAHEAYSTHTSEDLAPHEVLVHTPSETERGHDVAAWYLVKLNHRQHRK